MISTLGTTPSAHKQRPWSLWAVVAIWLGLVAFALSKPPNNFFAWDCFGYHLYLPGTFIEGDPWLKDGAWVEEARSAYDASGTLYQVSKLEDGTRVIKCPMGQALIWSPWFLLGHGVAAVTGAPMDGFSHPYQWCVAVGVLVYLLLGLLALRAVLVRVFTQWIAVAAVLLMIVGTNFIQQMVTDLTMPHLALFAVHGGVLYFTVRWRTDRAGWGAIVPLALLIGLAALIRPTEIMVVLLPLLWEPKGGPGRHLLSLWREWRQWVVFGLIICLVGALQLVYWKVGTGHWFVDTYNNPGEGFDPLSPHTVDFLFSYRKGWLLYTPLAGFCLLGLFLLFRIWRSAALAVFAFVVVYIYVTSTWSCWWYADSFGSRPMVAIYGELAIPLAALVTWVVRRQRWSSWMILSLIGLCVPLNLFQRWQFENGLIHTSRMTERAYWAVLGRTTEPEGFEDLLLVHRSYTVEQGAPDLSNYRKVRIPPEYTAHIPSDQDTLVYDSSTARMHTAYRLGPKVQWTPALHIPFEVLTTKDHAWVLAEWYVLVPHSKVHLTVTHSFERNGKKYGDKGFDLNPDDITAGRWDTLRTMYLTPEVRSRKDVLRMFFWSQDTARFLVDGPVITVYEPLSPQ